MINSQNVTRKFSPKLLDPVLKLAFKYNLRNDIIERLGNFIHFLQHRENPPAPNKIEEILEYFLFRIDICPRAGRIPPEAPKVYSEYLQQTGISAVHSKLRQILIKIGHRNGVDFSTDDRLLAVYQRALTFTHQLGQSSLVGLGACVYLACNLENMRISQDAIAKSLSCSLSNFQRTLLRVKKIVF